MPFEFIGKDQIIFATKEDLDKPSAALITANDNSEEEPGNTFYI